MIRIKTPSAGDRVERGQALATLTVAPLDARQRDEAQARLEAARVDAARADAAAAEAALLGDRSGGRTSELILRAPVAGKLLKLVEQSERLIPAGTVVMVIGDPSQFEIVADVLSTEAVRIRPEAAVLFERWGGERVLKGRVRRVEPYAFTKVSALGIEEKRVNVVIDPLESMEPLGDGYRVEARIVVWSAEDALKVPAAALFRRDETWRLFAIDGDRLRERTVKPAARNPREAALVEEAGEVNAERRDLK